MSPNLWIGENALLGEATGTEVQRWRDSYGFGKARSSVKMRSHVVRGQNRWEDPEGPAREPRRGPSIARDFCLTSHTGLTEPVFL